MLVGLRPASLCERIWTLTPLLIATNLRRTENDRNMVNHVEHGGFPVKIRRKQ